MTTISKWNGASADWTTASDWNSGVPSTTVGAAILGPTGAAYTLTISTPVSAYSLTVNDANATVADKGAISLGGHALQIQAGTFDLNTPGSVQNATVTAAAGTIQWNGGAFVNVKYLGPLDLTSANAALRATNLTVRAANGVSPGVIDLTGSNSQLVFESNQALSSTTLNLGADSGTVYVEDVVPGYGAGTLTLAGSTTVNVNTNAILASGNAAGDGIVNNGAIHLLNPVQGALAIDGVNLGDGQPWLNSFTNTGTITLASTITPVSPPLLGGGDRLYVQTYKFANSGSIDIGGNGVLYIFPGAYGNPLGQPTAFTPTPGGATVNSGVITLEDGGLLQSASVFTNSGRISLKSTGDETELAIENVGSFLNAGLITLSDNANNLIDGRVLLGPTPTGGPVPTGGPTTTDGPVSTGGGGVASPGFASFTNAGTLSGAGRIGVGNGALGLTNYGTLAANGASALIVDTGRFVTNSGQMRATGPGGLTLDDTVFNYGGGVQANGGSLVDLAGGSIDFGTITVNHNGLLEATGGAAQGSALNSVSVTDAGTLEALGGTTLAIAFSTLNDTGGVLEASSAGSIVTLDQTTVNGGALTTASGGVVETVAGDQNSALNGVTISAGSVVKVVDGSALQLEGTITLAAARVGGTGGEIAVGRQIYATAPGESWTNGIDVEGAVTLKGGGSVQLESNIGSDIFAASAGATLDNRADIAGSGAIGFTLLSTSDSAERVDDDNLTLTNDGVIDSTGALYLQTGNDVQNNGLIEVEADDSLAVADRVVGSTGNVIVKSGGTLQLDRGLFGGTLQIAAKASLVVDGSSTSASDVSLTHVAVNNSGVIAALGFSQLTIGQGASVLGSGILTTSSNDDSIVFNDALVSGATLQAYEGRGVFKLAANSSTTFQNVTNQSSIQFATQSSLAVGANFTVGTLQQTGATAVTLDIAGHATFLGSGAIEGADPTSTALVTVGSSGQQPATLTNNSNVFQNLSNAVLTIDDPNLTLTNLATISTSDDGVVTIATGSNAVVNKGTISAGGSPGAGKPGSVTMHAAISNSGVLSAESDRSPSGYPEFTSLAETLAAYALGLQSDSSKVNHLSIDGNVTQSGGGEILSEGVGSLVEILNGVVSGGALVEDNYGGFRLDAGTGLKNVKIAAGSVIETDGTSQAVSLAGTITLGAGADLQAEAGSTLKVSGAAVLAGTGELSLLSERAIAATLEGASGASLDNRAIIAGSGLIIGPALTNHGSVFAQGGGTLTLDTGLAENNYGLIEAQAASTLLIEDNLSQSATAQLAAIGGGTLKLGDGITVTGGTLRDDAGSTITTTVFGNATLNNLTLAAGTTIRPIAESLLSLEGTVKLGAGVTIENPTVDFHYILVGGVWDEGINVVGSATLSGGSVSFGEKVIGATTSGSSLTNRSTLTGVNDIGFLWQLQGLDQESAAEHEMFDSNLTFINRGIVNATDTWIRTGNAIDNAGGELDALNSGGEFQILDEVDNGKLKIGANGLIGIANKVKLADIIFDNSNGAEGDLQLNATNELQGTAISGFSADSGGHSDFISLQYFMHDPHPLSWNFLENGSGSQGLLTVTDQVSSDVLLLNGAYLAAGASANSTNSTLFSFDEFARLTTSAILAPPKT